MLFPCLITAPTDNNENTHALDTYDGKKKIFIFK